MTTQTAHTPNPVRASRSLLGARRLRGRERLRGEERQGLHQTLAQVSASCRHLPWIRIIPHSQACLSQAIKFLAGAVWLRLQARLGTRGSQGTCQPVLSGPWLTGDTCSSGESSLSPEKATPSQTPGDHTCVSLSLSLSLSLSQSLSVSLSLTPPPLLSLSLASSCARGNIQNRS